MPSISFGCPPMACVISLNMHTLSFALGIICEISISVKKVKQLMTFYHLALDSFCLPAARLDAIQLDNGWFLTTQCVLFHKFSFGNEGILLPVMVSNLAACKNSWAKKVDR